MDGLVIFWVLLWVLLGVLTGVTVWRAADVGDTIAGSGRALDSVGAGLQELSDLPLIPDRPGEIGREVTATAGDVTIRGAQVKQELRQLAVLLGVVIVAVPMTPVVGFYAPLRLRRAREVRRLRRLLLTRAGDPGLDRWLADRARSSLTFLEVEALADPAAVAPSLAENRRLADAELARLGMVRP